MGFFGWCIGGCWVTKAWTKSLKKKEKNEKHTNGLKLNSIEKKFGMHIGGKGMEKLQGNMVLNKFFLKRHKSKKISFHASLFKNE
jgi:hypothetical protein